MQLSVGRALLADRALTDTKEMRRRLEKKTYLQVQDGPEAKRRLIRADTAIRGLICETCNNGWARQFEEAAGENLYGFLNEGEPMDSGLLGRWIRFFIVKLHWHYQRTEQLQKGDRPLWQVFADPAWVPDGPLFMAELIDAPTTLLGISVNDHLEARWRGVTAITQAVVWFLPFSELPPPMGSTELRERLQRSELPPVTRAQLYKWVIDPRALVETQKLVAEIDADTDSATRSRQESKP